MAPKRSAAQPVVPPAATTATDNGASPPAATPAATPAAKSSGARTSESRGGGIGQTVRSIVRHYQKTTPQRTRLLDAFMVFLAVVGALQFAYCILMGNFPFNAFLSGFSATVGQFVLTASLRIQTTEASKSEFPSISPERAFADYVVGSLILHFFCINFIN
ncbi:hypothetical protein DL766_009304 [Monosporascus sp. MC13-8B]|uniref:Dolichyl-diphosphooligosaccharide--protein glycosyltransferase subunit OST2 n=1 Tax=Monosporascus cannonballus TaxID=155416 RepID=A0ABY0H9G7_9PEZI|nr:hypothetical protein DL762_003832 [Monosporascus cannonballus]RYO92825.1 hypothetical protein DL763_004550 [Monosporascus cannonballus]RYP15828.1 hypothetical protein DL766_009304 [Monosporascus sp. MC13-8B]